MNQELALIADRFCLTSFESEVVVFDVVTGAFYVPNPTALAFLALVGEGKSFDAAARQVAEIAGTKHRIVLADVDALLEHLEGRVLDSTRRVTPFEFIDRGPRGLVLMRGQDRILGVSRDGCTLTRLYGDEVPDVDLRAALFFAAAQVLMLRGQSMLHAAAIERRDDVLVLLGESGAGKTTTAHAFAECGAGLLATDLLPVAYDEIGMVALTGGEKSIASWAGGAEEALVAAGQIDTGLLVHTVRAAASKRLGPAWLIDRTRSDSHDLHLDRLSKAGAFMNVLGVGLGVSLSDRRGVMDQMAMTWALVSGRPVFHAATPYGVEVLRETIRPYVEIPSVPPRRRDFLRQTASVAAVAALATLTVCVSYQPPVLRWTGLLAQSGGGSGGCPFPNPRNPNCGNGPLGRRRALAQAVGRAARWLS